MLNVAMSGHREPYGRAFFAGADSQPTKGNKTMNWDRIEGNWKQFKGNVKQQWGKLTDDQLDVIAGKRDNLVGKIQETYGITKEATEKQISEWQSRQKELDHRK
jgi:uncharacterized protein YjbJ (UPF0337 family)